MVEGTYNENIFFTGANIILTSKDPDDPSVRNSTIIDGNHAGTVVLFSGGEDETCVLTGFTIRNGVSTYGSGIGVGPHSPPTRATIEKNLITGNRGAYGGGLFGCAGAIQHNFIIDNMATYLGGGLHECDGRIQDNAISGNSAGSGGGLAFCDGLIKRNAIANNGAQEGGGLALCHGDIMSNEIQGNTATDGGGLWGCDGRISGNLVSGNNAHGEDSKGGGLFDCGGTIIWNTIEGNSSGFAGGGLYGCHGDIRRNTIRANSAEKGGGLYDCDGEVRTNVIAGNSALSDPASGGGGLINCSGMIENTTIVGNAARRGGGLYICDGVIRNCIIWENTAPDFGPQLYLCNTPRYSCIQHWTGGGLGNTSLNPIFLNADGPDNDPNTFDDNDYRLQPYMMQSLCIDKGENQEWMRGAEDQDGNPRVFYGLSSATVDMGAYEYGSWPFKVVRLQKTPAGETELMCYSRPGHTYVVWSKLVLYSPGPIYAIWKEEVTRPSEGVITSWTDPASTRRRKFYRVELKL